MSTSNTLSIILPAYNEEAAIFNVCKTALGVKEYILQNTDLKQIEIIIVSDGSTDKTVQIVKEHFKSGIAIIEQEQNMGYGYTIQNGISNSTGNIICFYDCDSTCNPKDIVKMYKKLQEQNADIVVGSRLGPSSSMPKVRRFGNLLYAWFVNLLSKKRVTDIATGFRLFRRDFYNKILPLPTKMHFTPSMSARAIFDDRFKIYEVEVDYFEREGDSKINILKDGFLNLKGITDQLFRLVPGRVFGNLAILTFGAALLINLHSLFFIDIANVDAWIVNRFILLLFAVNSSLLLGSIASIAQDYADEKFNLVKSKNIFRNIGNFLLQHGFITGASVGVLGVVIMIPVISIYLKTGTLVLVWQRFVIATLVLQLGIEMFTIGILNTIIQNIKTYAKRD